MTKKRKKIIIPHIEGHKFEDVVRAFMKVDPEKVEKRLEKKGLSRKKGKEGS